MIKYEEKKWANIAQIVIEEKKTTKSVNESNIWRK